ncbi:MAG: hypothetical protein ACYTKD_04925 [Planctomycetota bacterium]|jgi:hypothetical protein
MADMLEAVHSAVSVTCTTMFEKGALAEAPIGAILEAVRPEGESIALKASRLAKRILYEAYQQGQQLGASKSDLADWLAESAESKVSDLVTHLEGLA